MEKRKESLSVLKICRFCLCQDETLISLYDTTGKPKNAISISLKILYCMSIEVFPSDKMPCYICSKCKFFLDLFYEYKQVFRQADENILQYVQNGAELETVEWPLKLLRIFPNAAKKTLPRKIMKTILQDGATVQVTSQEMYDSDDDESVFDIKIGSGPDNEQKDGSTTIKVVTNDQAQCSKSTENLQSDSKDSDAEASAGSLAVRSGCWPCDECNCTYPLQQLLELHKSQKHRARTVSCHQCDAKFFTKYDLMTHQLRHSDEMPFECVACGRKFRRLILLKRHERLMHADVPQLPCPNCPATFLSIEEVTAHQKKHAKMQNRQFACSYCPKRFHEKTTLQRHVDTIHHNKPGFRCEYCPEQFSSVSKLTRHVRTHASVRGYPCKYCDKSFLKSHHYTRHLRAKHPEAVRSGRGSFGQSDHYRCEQCEDSFNTQDELIYHSAIHATQNLTCPLCQEKFENVDAVTAHIKSHVNGVEFMCDFCELVFTSKAKLDIHLASAHSEEIDIPLPGDESSMDMDDEDYEEDDNAINVKEEEDHMVVEIKKPAEFIVNDNAHEDTEEKINTNSEDSEAEATYTELETVDTLALMTKAIKPEPVIEKSTPKPAATPPADKTERTGESNQTASILRKAEEIKRKVQQKAAETPKVAEKEKPSNKPESTNSAGASDKSLRLLEKELQELQRTNTRNEAAKAATKTVDSLRSRRPQVHTSTPKTRAVDEKKSQAATKSPAVEKKLPERRVVTKENKEPKEKEAKTNNTSSKEEKESKEKETPKSAMKNGGAAADKSTGDETIRRSTRPSKIKDYAKMVQDKSQDSEDDESDMDDEEYDVEESRTSRSVRRRSVTKPPPKPAGAPARKRGRPRKEPLKEVPNKVKKADPVENEDAPAEKSDKEEEVEENTATSVAEPEKTEEEPPKEPAPEPNVDTNKPNSDSEPKPATGVLVSPTGQTLKKVPIRSLPPGVRPLPLPMSARPMGPGELCEMQIGKKVVKVQKIVMTKAEVEAMAKKGLVEMKDGNMVLKPGIKLPTSDPVAFKSSLVGEKDAVKESLAKNKAQAQEKEAS